MIRIRSPRFPQEATHMEVQGRAEQGQEQKVSACHACQYTDAVATGPDVSPGGLCVR